MRKLTSWLIFLPISFSSCTSQKTQYFLVGTYTDSINQGINHIKFSASSNEIKSVSIIDSIINPSFVIANKINPKL